MTFLRNFSIIGSGDPKILQGFELVMSNCLADRFTEIHCTEVNVVNNILYIILNGTKRGYDIMI